MKTILSEHVKAWRKARGLSQEQAAMLLFVSVSTLSKWEQGVTKEINPLLLPRIKPLLWPEQPTRAPEETKR